MTSTRRSASGSTGSSPSRGSSTFASLRIPAYRTLWLGGTASFLAIQMQFVVRGWLAKELSSSNLALGIMSFAFGLPMLIFTPFGGLAADRLSKRRILQWAQLALVGSALFLAVAVGFGFVQFWMLVAASVVQGASFSFVGPARVSFAAELTGKENLANAVVLTQLSLNGTRVFGPSLAGYLLALKGFGSQGVLCITAFLMMVSVLLNGRLPEGRSTRTVNRAPLEDLRAGVAYVRRERHLGLLVVTSTLVVMFAFPYITFLPSVAKDLYGRGSSAYGMMNTAIALGAVLVSLTLASRMGHSRRRDWNFVTLSGLGFGGFVLLLGLTPSFGWAVVACALVGGASAGYQSVSNSLLATESAAEYRGRVQALAQLSFSAFGMIALPLGALADVVGLRETLVIMGAVAVAATVAFQALRSWADAAS